MVFRNRRRDRPCGCGGDRSCLGNSGNGGNHRRGCGNDQRRHALSGRHDDVWIDDLHDRPDGFSHSRPQAPVRSAALPESVRRYGGLATSGTLTRWFRDRFARELDEVEAFRILAEEAATSPIGARGLLFLPYFSGERTPIHDPDAKGCFFGLNLTHSRGDLYRALIEGIAYGANHAIEAYAENGLRPERLPAVGGGTRNRLWLQAISDVCGLDQSVRANSAGASYGGAFLASLAVGTAEPDDIVEWNPVAEHVAAERDPVYDRNHALFRRLYEQTKNIAVALKL